MIKTITICNHKSFHPTAPYPVRFDSTKTATYVYGLNGAGKSAIGEVVDGLARNEPAFNRCKIETTDNAKYRYMVFNHHFVARVIGQPLKGIFTVGEVDTARQQRIQEVEAQVQALAGEIAVAEQRSEALEGQITNELARARSEIWKAYERGKDTSLADLLRGYGNSKDKFFQELRTFVLPEDGQLDSLERLEKRWADVSGSESERFRVSLDTDRLATIEGDPIWGEAIEVSATSRLAALVAQLGNADWVARGQQYLHQDQCPFCQQGLPHDFRVELARLLEGERKAKVDKIASLVQAYQANIHVLENRVQTILADPDAANAGLDLAWAELSGKLHEILTRMRAKEAEPSAIIDIELTNTQALQGALGKLNVLIEDFNARISDRMGERERIRLMFYQVLLADRVEAYAHHDALVTPLREAKTQASADADTKRQELIALNDELRELRRQQKGVDASIDAINERLKILGITELSIQRKQGEGRLYCLYRPGVPECSPESLSEGEKTLIAFLYFMEALKGSHDEEEHIDPKRTIAVIDDPISSLSQNYVYDIATMIKRELSDPENRPQRVKQVIVLTHNLYFFHELIRQHTKNLGKAHSKCGLLRVVRNQYSEVADFNPALLMNDYDVWWYLLKDAHAGKVPTQVVPNAMRNILEQFFTFTTGSPEFPEAVKKLANEDTSSKYLALDRFVDRGSHRDGINGLPIDWSVYDVPYLLGKLRAMFAALKQEEHYRMKMGEDTPEAKAQHVAMAGACRAT
ncbi:AAA family ATPase [Xanthomonas albilineans]|uniref:AAA family ATPase n=1 Tax=Xanthomonas albilineans TaxID=29447 RepID=UPI0005F33964|nr:AAA family ATPase [Xanthomonas albilineans]